MLQAGSREFPHLEELASQSRDAFAELQDADGRIGFEEFQRLLQTVDNSLRALPPTAQVAKQEAEYVAGVLNAAGTEAGGDLAALTPEQLGKFVYGHKGSLAYIGRDAAVLDLPGVGILKGIAAGFIWKGFETYSQFSLRNKLLLAGDFVRAKVFGRDVSRTKVG